MFIYITTGSGQLLVGKLKPFVNVNHAFPPRFFITLHAFFVIKIFEFGIQPPVEPQDARFKSSYKYTIYYSE